MRIITCNVNGIRAAAKKGLFSWLRRQKADVVCLQEVRANTEDIPKEGLNPGNLSGIFYPAQRKGYAGCALYVKTTPDRIQHGFGWSEADQEGRYVRADWGPLSVISVYVPSGSSSEDRQAAKYRFMDRFYPVLAKIHRSGRHVVLCGDWNIAHTEKDLKNWRSNKKNSGFLPEERAWMTRIFDEMGLVDVFRYLNQEEDQYTWWCNRGQAWQKNVGWRLDYQIATPSLAKRAVSTTIYKKKRFSDHAPLIIDYDYDLSST